MGKKRTRRRKAPKVAMDRKKPKARFEALGYVLIVILLGIIFYSVYIQILHHF